MMVSMMSFSRNSFCLKSNFNPHETFFCNLKNLFKKSISSDGHEYLASSVSRVTVSFCRTIFGGDRVGRRDERSH